MPEAVIVSAARTPIGRANKGSLKDFRPDDLTALAVQAALDKIPDLDPATIEDLLLGCGLPGGESGNNMARVVTTLLGLEVPGATVTRYCSSSVQTTRMAFHAIKAGEGDIFVSAGVETVSRFAKGTSDHIPGTRNPLFEDAAGADRRVRPGRQGLARPARGRRPPRHLHRDGPDGRERRPDARPGPQGARRVRRPLAEPRREGDRRRVLGPRDHPRHDCPTARSSSTDDGPRAGVTYDAIAGLDPVFRPDGVVTAGNCCALNDGAAAVVVMSDTKAAELGLTPLARIVSTGVSGLSPEIMGLGPVEATRNALKYAGMSIGDIDLVEINEAFAAQVVPSYQDLGIDLDRLNVNGGAIAVGHPFGMTGARLQNTMINSLDWHDKSTGLITMCVGGGQGMAMILERMRLSRIAAGAH